MENTKHSIEVKRAGNPTAISWNVTLEVPWTCVVTMLKTNWDAVSVKGFI